MAKKKSVKLVTVLTEWRGPALNGARFLVPSTIWLLCAAGGSQSGKVVVDGSSTVEPITTVAAEMIREKNPNLHVSVGISGTGGGFKKFLDEDPKLRTDISDASRPIKPAELERAKKNGVEFIEVPVALDGLAVVVNPSNTFCTHLTVEELKKIWEPGSKINNWKDVRQGFPDLPLKLFGAGTDSGTFDYFTEAIMGKERASRSDYMASENDNTLVQGVAGNKGAMGYFGYSYAEINQGKVNTVAIDPGDGKPVAPNPESIRTGAYKPLARPLFIYVNKTSYARPEVKAYVDFILENARQIVEHKQVMYVALSDELYALGKERLRLGKTGTVFKDSSESSPKNLLELYRSR
jgi:phosphate transport system substrate-binding protein